MGDDRGGPAHAPEATRKSAIVERILTAAILVALMATMDYLYVRVLVGPLENTIYPYVRRPIEFTLLSWVIGLLPMLWLPMRVRRPSDVLLWCVYLMVMVPTSACGVYATQSSVDIVLMLVALIAGLAVLSMPRLLPPLRIPMPAASRSLFWFIVGGMTIVCYVATLLTFGRVFRIVSLQEVYTQRLLAQSLRAPLLVSYAITWQELVVNPMLMALGLSRRRPLLFLLGVGGQIFLFGVAAQRITLATPLMVLGFHFLLRRGGGRFGVRAALGSLAAFAIPLVVVAQGETTSLTLRIYFEALLNRLFLDNGFLTALYFKFFSLNPKVAFTQTKPFNSFFESPYSDPYPVALAWHEWGDVSHPNVNVLADGFAQLGVAGLFIEAAGLAILFWLLDSVARQRNLSVWLVGMCGAAQVTSIANASISNIIFGGGFAVMLMLFTVIPRSIVQPRP